MTGSKISKIYGVGIFYVLLFVAVGLQYMDRAYSYGYGSHGDEAAHFVTSLMVRDFIAHPDLHLMRFADQYYLHYPKVALGHWPPVFYAILGTWLLIFGTSHTACMIFIATIAASTATILYFLGNRLLGYWAGAFAALLFILTPMVQDASVQVMTDHLATLFTLISALQFARFMHTERTSDVLLFGCFTAIAILTHGGAWALAGVPILSIIVTRRYGLLRHYGLWMAVTPIVLLCLPWYVLTLSFMTRTWANQEFSWLFAWQLLRNYIYCLWFNLGFFILLSALLGIWSKIVIPWRAREIAPEWAVLIALVIAKFCLHCLIPASWAESRYILVLVPCVLLFAAAGAEWTATKYCNIAASNVWKPILVSALAVLCILQTFTFRRELENGGYEAMIKSITAEFPQKPQIYMLASDSIGEGSAIAAIAVNDKQRPDSIAYRGSKKLILQDWLRHDIEAYFHTPAELARILDDLHVSIIVIDYSVPPEERHAYYPALEVLMADKSNWKEETFPFTRFGKLYKDALHVYIRRQSL